MKLGVLETGAPPAALADRFGDYPAMFRRLLGEGAYEYRAFDAAGGELPDVATACDAYLVTGSAAGVYDPLPWISALKDFLIEARGQVPLVGVCFGHQVMAEAFGGRVEKSSKGWGVGLQSYAIQAPRPWTEAGVSMVTIPGSHQDQVVEVPPDAVVVGGNDFCPNGLLAYPGQGAISMQLHPEFEPAYAVALIESRRGARINAAQADAAVASYARADDRARVGGWIRRFLADPVA